MVSDNLTLLELFPIIVTVELWGERLLNRQVVFWSDNISIVRSSTCFLPDPLLHFLALRCFQFNTWFKAMHVPGVADDIANALSHS